MADITRLILADHEWFREQFAKLDYLQARAHPRPEDLQRVWGGPLGDKLDVHAYAEEAIFYPQLLTRGHDDPEGGRPSTQSATTTTSVMASGTRTTWRSAATSGGPRWDGPARPTTNTWVKRSARASPTSASTPPPPDFGKRSVVSTTPS